MALGLLGPEFELEPPAAGEPDLEEDISKDYGQEAGVSRWRYKLDNL
jgi:hypothetical protein